MRLLLLSTELPSPTRGGSLCLHRLLHGLPGAEVEILTHEQEEFVWPGRIHRARRGRLFYRYWHSRFGTRLQTASLTRGWEMPRAAARRVVRDVRPDFLVTVAYGPALVSARLLAEETGLPLASLFMDWWPDLACNHLDAPRARHPALEREFRRLHHASRVSFPFSPEMRQELGPRPGDPVLYPVVGEALPDPPRGETSGLAYAGLATGLYAASLSGVARSPGRGPADHLDLMAPGLPAALADDFPPGLRYHGFVPAAELTERLRAAAALLVVLPFDPADRRLARTSFSSKFAEYCRLGRPIIIWGPADAAIVRFALETRSALVVTQPCADAVWEAFHHVKSHPEIARNLVAGATHAHANHFAPGVVRARFTRALTDALSR